MYKLLHIGFGPLGRNIVRMAYEKGWEIVGVVDVDPKAVGGDVGELCGMASNGVIVTDRLSSDIVEKADIAIVTTVSSLDRIERSLVQLAGLALPVISTCEELSFPWRRNPDTARRIDDVFRTNGVACLGTGVNPGYLMDYLPTIASAVCQKVDSVSVERVQNASKRRVPFQQKIGVGLSLEEFEDRKQSGTLRHVGLSESIDFVAYYLGWEIDRIEETLEPVVAESENLSAYIQVKPGMARGVHQVGHGFSGDKEVVTLTFHAAIGESESNDRIYIKGTPAINLTFPGGVHGDIATCAIALNSVRSVLHASPGLRTMADIPAPAFTR